MQKIAFALPREEIKRLRKFSQSVLLYGKVDCVEVRLSRLIGDRKVKYDTSNQNLHTKKGMRENINKIVDCIERKSTDVHAEIFDVSPILSFQEGF